MLLLQPFLLSLSDEWWALLSGIVTECTFFKSVLNKKQTSLDKQPDVAVCTCPLCGSGLPVVESAAQHSIFAGLQHDIAAHKPPHRAPAVSQQATQRQGTWAVVGDPKHQHTQIQQVALCCVPPPEDRRRSEVYSWISVKSFSFHFLLPHLFAMDVITKDFLTHTVHGIKVAT